MARIRAYPEPDPTSRRRFIRSAALMTGLSMVPAGYLSGNDPGSKPAAESLPGSEPGNRPAGNIEPDYRVPEQMDTDRRYKIAVCDWMILKRQKPGAFKLAGEIGADGVEVDMGSLGQRPTFENRLLDPVERRAFLEEAKKYSLEISSMAMSGFYAQSFAERETVPLMIRDCINTMVLVGTRTAFLPLGVRGDLVQHPELRPAIVERLKMAGEMAGAAGVVIGIETALPASDEAGLLAEVGSPSVKSYFNFANALQNGRDLVREIRTLGREMICQIHCTDQDGQLLEDNTRLDMPRVRQALDEMNWSGWLVLERSRDATNPHDVVGNFGANTRYLRSIFKE